uniref:Zinc finger protein 511 n=1 Tax=Gouania willdenowi TaxID=441366 RepID=A0A8C5H310_GOUWI
CPRPQLFPPYTDSKYRVDIGIRQYSSFVCRKKNRPQVPFPELLLCCSVSELACHISGCSGTFSTLEDYEHHYNTLHRHVCCSCRRSLPSARLLDIHIQEWHDPLFTILAQRQDMYQCLVEGCGLKFSTSKHRKEHLIRIHKYPPDFRFDRGKKEKGAQELKRQQPKDDMAMDVVQDVCDSEGTCDLMCNVSCSDQLEPGESMETQVLKDKGDGLPSSASTEDPSTDAQHRTALKPQYSYRVPSTVCFGHGSVRGFRGRRGRRK